MPSSSHPRKSSDNESIQTLISVKAQKRQAHVADSARPAVAQGNSLGNSSPPPIVPSHLGQQSPPLSHGEAVRARDASDNISNVSSTATVVPDPPIGVRLLGPQGQIADKSIFLTKSALEALPPGTLLRELHYKYPYNQMGPNPHQTRYGLVDSAAPLKYKGKYNTYSLAREKTITRERALRNLAPIYSKEAWKGKGSEIKAGLKNAALFTRSNAVEARDDKRVYDKRDIHYKSGSQYTYVSVHSDLGR